MKTRTLIIVRGGVGGIGGNDGNSNGSTTACVGFSESVEPAIRLLKTHERTKYIEIDR